MISLEGIAEVERIVRDVAAGEVVPRFRNLADTDVAEKNPGDPVTVADRAAEKALTERLTRFLPGSVVVGEEAVADDPSVLRILEGPEPVWIIDPIDGTRNFVAGSPRFCTLVALARHGELLASWTHAPVLGMTATALAGHGAWLDGKPMRVAPAGRPLAGMDVATSHPDWWPDRTGYKVANLRGHGIDIVLYDCSGLEYLEVAAGRRTAVVVTWEHPWDHAAGLLLVAEAGGAAATADQRPFRLSGGNRLPFIVATDEGTVASLHKALVTRVDQGSAGALR